MDDYLLNSSSPLSELPATWNEWEKLYQSGKIDLNDPPPPPPGDRDDDDFRPLERFSRISGHYIAPTPEGDFERSRKVEALGVWKDQWGRGTGLIDFEGAGGDNGPTGKSWKSEVEVVVRSSPPSPRSSLSAAFSTAKYSPLPRRIPATAACLASTKHTSSKIATDQQPSSFPIRLSPLIKISTNLTLSSKRRRPSPARTAAPKPTNGTTAAPIAHHPPTPSPTPSLAQVIQQTPPSTATTPARDEQSGLQYIAELTRRRFNSNFSKISLLGRTESVFIAESARERPDVVPRTATACDHLVLKAMIAGAKKIKSEPMVVLDFDKDWRFVGSPEIPFSQMSFWAAAPIFLPRTLADLDAEGSMNYPIGSLCILDFKPRKFFSNEDREKLCAMAELAGMEIRRLEEEKRGRNMARLRRQRDGWRIESAKRREIMGKGLETVIESPEEDVEPNAFDEAAAGRSRMEFETTLLSPIVTSSNRSVLSIVDRHAQLPSPPAIVDILDLSTRLISETLELDFVYFISIPTTGVGDEQASIRLLSSFNDRAYQFDVAQHQDLAKSKFDNLLFIPSPPGSSSSSFASSSITSATSTASRPLIRRHFTTGIVTKVISKEGECYLLGAMSDDEKRVLQRDDLAWLQGFAQDLRRFV